MTGLSAKRSRRSILANSAIELVMLAGVLGAIWLAMGLVLGDGWAPALWRGDREAGLELARTVGIAEEPEVLVIPDPQPATTPTP